MLPAEKAKRKKENKNKQQHKKQKQKQKPAIRIIAVLGFRPYHVCLENVYRQEVAFYYYLSILKYHCLEYC